MSFRNYRFSEKEELEEEGSFVQFCLEYMSYLNLLDKDKMINLEISCQMIEIEFDSEVLKQRCSIFYHFEVLFENENDKIMVCSEFTCCVSLDFLMNELLLNRSEFYVLRFKF